MRYLIITPNFNSSRYLDDNFDRLIQEKKNAAKDHFVTWIIIDADSKDGSLSIFRKNISVFGREFLRKSLGLDIRLRVQKDKGMYDGINNGLKWALEEGVAYDLFFWLNSDDRLAEGCFDSMAAAFAGFGALPNWIICRGVDIDAEGKIIHDEPHICLSDEQLEKGDFNYTTGKWVKAESCVFNRPLVDKLKGFDSGLRLAGDYDFILRASQIIPPRYENSVRSREYRRHEQQQSRDLLCYERERKRVRVHRVGAIKSKTHLLHKMGGTIYFYPDYSSGNAYQKELYGSRVCRGFRSLESLKQESPELKEEDVFHLHWLNDISRREPEDAQENWIWLRNFIESSKDSGAQLIWTIHNIISHESKNREIETEVCRYLINTCDRFHVHDESVIYEFQKHYGTLPWGRVRIVEHGAYRFETAVRPAGLMTEYGLVGGEDYVVVPGQIRYYKNLPLLIEASKYLGRRQPELPVLLLGSFHPELSDSDIQSVTRLANVRRVFSRLDDSQYGAFVRDAAFSLMTYRQISTSGSAIHSLSQGTPIVAPEMGAIPGLILSDIQGWLYSNEDIASLYAALDSALATRKQARQRRAVRSTVEPFRWDTMLDQILM